uniref:Angiotensin-converting enzyme n=1 Tax=Equus caballus TaxID=9796 RepID=A0A9L0S5M0_HORSE
MDLPWTFPTCALLYGHLLPWLRTEGDQSSDDFYNETMAKIFLQYYENTTRVVWNRFMEASWNYVTNINQQNLEEMLLKDMERSQHMLFFGTQARLFKIARFQDPVVKHMLSKLQNIDKAALPKDELQEVMEGAPRSPGTCSPGESGDWWEDVMATSRDQKELLWAWQGWRDAVGPQVRMTFERYVQLSNKAAKLNGYEDMGALWQSMYESDTLEQDLEHLYQELQPLYLNLHAYVRRALHRHYGPELIDLRGPIPAHLLGNMWAQSWVNILDLVLPFPKKPLDDITRNMKVQHWKPEKMFIEAENFYTSLGLLSTPPDFWRKSMMERPADGREVECHASAWDFYNGQDFRIKKCTEVTIEDLLSIFHQMGHIQYFLQYKNLSVIFRAGTNPAFEEAVGLVIILSVFSHKHLLNKGLLSHQHQDSEEEVNFLMGIALDKIAFIPFAYLMDLSRWKVFDGTIQKDVYNQEWWSLRLKYQGLCPPTPRTEEDFDPAAKFHISASMPYLRYFLSLVLQFQFHEALCKATGHMGLLHRCDIYNSKMAGKLLEDVLKLGSSKPWPEVLEKITGETKVPAKAIMTYSKLLLNWLVTENVQQGEILGWPDFSCYFEEKETDKVTFLSLELDPNQVNFGQWVLLALSFVMFLVALLLACRLHSLEKRSPAQDTSVQDISTLEIPPKAYFLGIAMEPRQAVKRRSCWAFNNRKPLWMKAEWWSWD